MSKVTNVVIMGGVPTDEVYGVDFGEGEITWNVTKIKRCIAKGEFGPPIEWDGPMPSIDQLAEFNVERRKVEFMKKRPDILVIPVIGIEGDDKGPRTCSVKCFVDGNHRLVAITEMGLKVFSFYMVPREREEEFRVTFMIDGVVQR